MLRITTTGLTLKVASLLKRVGVEPRTSRTAPIERPSFFTRAIARLEELDREAAEDKDGFWSLLVWTNGTERR